MDHELETFISKAEDINDTVKWIRYHFLAEKGRIPFHHLCHTLCHLPDQQAATHLFASFAGLTLAPTEELPLNVALSYSDVSNGLQQQPSSSSMECTEEDYLTTAILIDLSSEGSVSFEDFISFMQLAHDALEQDPSNARTCFNTFYDCLKERLRLFLPDDYQNHNTLENRLTTMAEKMRLSAVPTLPLMALAHFTDKKAAENESMTIAELMHFMVDLEGKQQTEPKSPSQSYSQQPSLSSPTPVPEPATGKSTGYTPMREKANELIDDFFNFASTTNLPPQTTKTVASAPLPTSINSVTTPLPVVVNTASSSSDNSSSSYAAAMLDFPSPPQKTIPTVPATLSTVVDNDIFASKDPFADMNEPTKEVKSEKKEIVNTNTNNNNSITTVNNNNSNNNNRITANDLHSPIKTSWAVSDPLEAFPSPPITPKLPMPSHSTAVGGAGGGQGEGATPTSTSFAASQTPAAASTTPTAHGRSPLPTTSPSVGYTRTFPSPAGLPFDSINDHHNNNNSNTTRVTQLFTESSSSNNPASSSSTSAPTKSAQSSQHNQQAVIITKRRISPMTLKPPPLTNVPMTEDNMDDGLDLPPPPPPPASSSPEERRGGHAKGHVPPKDWNAPPSSPVANTPPAPAPVTSAVPTPALVTSAVAASSPVANTPPVPALVTSEVPTPALVTSAVPTPALVTSAVPTPALVTSAVPTPALVTSAVFVNTSGSEAVLSSLSPTGTSSTMPAATTASMDSISINHTPKTVESTTTIAKPIVVTTATTGEFNNPVITSSPVISNNPVVTNSPANSVINSSPIKGQQLGVPATSSLSDHVQMLRNNVEVLSAKMADQKEDVEMSLELWSILKELEEQLKTTTAGGALVAAGGSISAGGGMGGGKGMSANGSAAGVVGSAVNAVSLETDVKSGGGGNSHGSSGSSSSLHDDRSHSNALPISSNTATNTNTNHSHKHASSSSEMDQMYQQSSPANNDHHQQYNHNNNHHNHIQQSSHVRQSVSSGGSTQSKQHRNTAGPTTGRFEKNGVPTPKIRSFQSPPRRSQTNNNNNHTRSADLSMDTAATNPSHLCLHNQTNTTITTNHTSSSSVPNLSIFKSPMAKYRPEQKNMYDERRREWKKPKSFQQSQQPSKYQERFQYPADIARWTKLNAMLKPY